MICISNGILPDLGDLNEDKQPKKEETPLYEFSYDNTLEEIAGAMKSFQSRFKNRRHTLSVVAYAVIGAAVIVAINVDPDQFFAYAALIFCLVGLLYSLTDKKRARAKTHEALRDMNPEAYKATFYGDRIEIETLIKPKENEVHVKIDEEADDEIISPLKSTFIPGSDLLEFIENDEALLLIFNRQQIFCFPNRCLSVDQVGAVRDYLTNRLSGE